MLFEFEELESQKENLNNRLPSSKKVLKVPTMINLENTFRYICSKQMNNLPISSSDMILIQKTFEVAGDSKANEKLYHLWSIVIHKQKSPNDLFKYLKRKEIGSELYSFYKDYCNYLESFGRLIECDQIYQLGIENKAKPFDKMLEGYADFIKRKQADLRLEITNEQNQKTAKITKTNGKFQVYQGEEESEVEEGGGFDFTSAQKENEREKEKMKGSTLVQKPVKQQKKLKVFKDNDDSKVPKEDRYKEPGFLHRGERKVDDNTVCCFVDGLSFEENRAAYLEANPKPEIEDPEFEISMDIGKFEEELGSKEDLDQEEEELDQDEKESNVDPNDNPLFAFLDSPKPLKVRNVEEITIHTKDAMKDVLDLFNQPMEEDLFSEEKSEAQAAEEIAQATELDSVLSQFKQQNPSPASPITRKPQSPTIHTKEAIQDIFEMFNQPIDKEKNDFVVYNPEDDETISKQCFQRPKVGVMVFKDEDESEEDVKHGDSDLDEFFGRGKDDKSRSEFFEKAQSDLDDNYPEFFAAQDPNTPMVKSKTLFGLPVHVMTPLTETSDTMLYKFNQSIELDTINETIGHEDSDSCDESSDEEIGFENPVDPTNLEVRKKILANQKIPSTEFFHLKPTITSNYMTEITSYPSQITLNNTQIEITKSLSTNKDVKVYRYDNKVIKVYANKTVWEYYILNQIQKRFNSDMYLEFTLFQNESVLQMDYQGLNLSQFDRLQLDVKQIIIKVCQQVLKLHDVGIIHGDICIENICLQNNDITLVDYAASIDLTVFQDEQYFRLEGGMKDVWERDGWKFEPDWFGVGAVLYYLLVGESLEVVKLEKVKVAGEGLYLEFEELFDLLLNFDSTSSLDSKRLRDLVKSE